jgi:hypothetical protein
MCIMNGGTSQVAQLSYTTEVTSVIKARQTQRASSANHLLIISSDSAGLS